MIRLALFLILFLSGCAFEAGTLDAYPCNAQHPQCPAGQTCNGAMCAPTSDGGIDR